MLKAVRYRVMIMSAAEACPGHFSHKKCLGRTLRECTSQKRDNVVLIEVDSDDFGDVIILDVPESFHKKFRKKPRNVISIDDDDDDDNSERRSAACKPNGDATARDRVSPTSVAHSSDSVDVDRESVGEGITPVKLSKSKRTYSGKSVSRNRYGLSSDENCSFDIDCSDCEFMGESSGRLNEQTKKASFTQPHDKTRDFPESDAGSPTPDRPAHNGTEEVAPENSEPLCQQSNLVNRTEDVTSEHPEHLPKQNIVEVSEPSSSRRCFNHEMKESCHSSAKELAGECNSTQQDGDAMETDEVFIADNSANINESSHFNVESPALSERDQGPGKPSTLSEDVSYYGHDAHDEAKSSNDQSFVIIDRQKMKETDEYKRAMEEEWASRQQQLQLQAEEAQRLRTRKRAENLRIKANEKRQMQRLEEMRETRRKDEENLNLKDQLRVEIRNELRKLERMCGDMSSLLRCLGIHIGGPYPSPNEIQAAYKRACLKFHPDRYAKSDLRQQVEAEEKFKLISNMKDKLLFK